MFPWEVISRVPLASGHLVEDMKLGLDLAEMGKAPFFFPFVKVTSEFPTSAKGTESQRQRWVQGHLAIITKVPRLLALGVMRGNVSLIVLALDLLVPPLSLFALLIIATMALALADALFGGRSSALLIAGVNLAAFILCILLAWVKFGRHVLSSRDALSLVFFAVRKLGFYGRMLSANRASKWIRTDRTKTK